MLSDSCKTATMRKIPLQFSEVKETSWNNVSSSHSHAQRWTRVYILVLFVCDVLDLSLCASVAGAKVEHDGLCPNKLNSNLWVDAQSTCERDCSIDEVSSFI